MPTGYTELLRKKNYNLKQWLKEDCIRQFGVLYFMRDDGDYSQKEIIAKLTELTNYKQEKPEPINEENLKEEYKKHIKYYSDKLQKTEKNYTKYKKSVDTLNKLWQYSATELTRNVIKFARNQLNLIKDDFDIDIKIAKEQLNLSFKDFKIKKQEDYEFRLKIYKEDVEKDKILHKDRLNNYMNFVDEIDNLFNKLESNN